MFFIVFIEAFLGLVGGGGGGDICPKSKFKIKAFNILRGSPSCCDVGNCQAMFLLVFNPPLCCLSPFYLQSWTE